MEYTACAQLSIPHNYFKLLYLRAYLCLLLSLKYTQPFGCCYGCGIVAKYICIHVLNVYLHAYQFVMPFYDIHHNVTVAMSMVMFLGISAYIFESYKHQLVVAMGVVLLLGIFTHLL